MFGYIAYRSDCRRPEMGERRLMGLRFFHVVLPRAGRWQGKRYAARAAKAMAKRGIRQAVFPVDFPYGEQFACRGILPVDTLRLHQRMAPQVLRKRLAARGLTGGNCTVAVVGEHMTAELEKILRELALQVRYLALSMASDTEGFCYRLRREYGVSVLQRPTQAQMAGAEALLLFAPAEMPESENPVVLHLYDGERITGRNGVVYGLPPQLEGELEDNCCKEQVLAVLLGEDILQNDQIPVLEVDIGGKSYYNASIVII